MASRMPAPPIHDIPDARVYRVGGAVRDKWLGLPVKDNDWVVVGATPEQMLAQGFLPVGKDFPVFLHPVSKEEYALARTERKTAHGYTGFAVHAAASVTLEEDLARRDSIDDRVEGLNAGADDYLTKPFDMKELQARIDALLRRARLPAFGGTLQIAAGEGRFLRLDPQLPLAWLGDSMLEVTQREWSLLSLLVARAGQVVSREDVLAVWQNDAADATISGSNALEVYVHRLRRKLAATTIQIRNVRGLGYTLTAGT